jgi:hypothetical protein
MYDSHVSILFVYIYSFHEQIIMYSANNSRSIDFVDIFQLLINDIFKSGAFYIVSIMYKVISSHHHFGPLFSFFFKGSSPSMCQTKISWFLNRSCSNQWCRTCYSWSPFSVYYIDSRYSWWTFIRRKNSIRFSSFTFI